MKTVYLILLCKFFQGLFSWPRPFLMQIKVLAVINIPIMEEGILEEVTIRKFGADTFKPFIKPFVSDAPGTEYHEGSLGRESAAVFCAVSTF